MSDRHLVIAPAFYQPYIDLVPEQDVIEALAQSGESMKTFLLNVPNQMADYRYDDGKWSVKQVLSHLIDGERIFCYRALRFARNDQTELSGFEENDYAEEDNSDGKTLDALKNEMIQLRRSTVQMFEGFSKPMLARVGIANSVEFNVATIGFIIAGHERHHKRILEERYLS